MGRGDFLVEIGDKQEADAPEVDEMYVAVPSNSAARGKEPRAKTTYTASLHIKGDQMRTCLDASLTHAGD